MEPTSVWSSYSPVNLLQKEGQPQASCNSKYDVDFSLYYKSRLLENMLNEIPLWQIDLLK